MVVNHCNVGGVVVKNVCVALLILISTMSICACNNYSNNDVVRIHIRGNSNSYEDQEVKLKVRDGVIEYITPLLAECENSVEVKDMLSDQLNNIEKLSDIILMQNGYSYISTAKISNEFFPSRKYEDNVFPADYYDALIIELGRGVGDNWWCVAYPPLCFVGNVDNSGSVRYKSKLLELINNYLGG